MISVVVPLYNKGPHIRRALDSVLAQTDDDFEVIVVNDGSTDGSEGFVMRYTDPRVRLVNQANAGCSAARNRGVAEARADLIAFLDADDEWMPEHLATIRRLAARHPACGAYSTAFEIVTAGNRRVQPSFVDIPTVPYEGLIPNYFHTAFGCQIVSSSTVAIPMKVLGACGSFTVGVKSGEDMDLWCRIALKYRFAFSTYKGAVVHQDVGGRTGLSPRALGEFEAMGAVDEALASGELPVGVTRDDLVEYMNERLIVRAMRNVMHGHPADARRLLTRASSTRVHRGRLRRWIFLSYVPAPLVNFALDLRLSATSSRSRQRRVDAGNRPSAAAGRQRESFGGTPVTGTVAASVVIPLYNKARHISRALDSVLAQTCQDFELVVVNDGSTDGSERVVERYADPRIRLVQQANAGVSAARNRGIAEARADLIAFLDADDEWLPGHLETILRLRRKCPGCGAYATAFRIVTPRGEKTPPFIGIPAPPYEGVIPNYFRTVHGDHAVWTSAVAVHREAFNDCGPFPVGEPRREDLDMWCRIALKYPIAFSTDEGAVYHQEADNRVGNTPPELTEPRIVRTLENALAAGKLPDGVTSADLLEYMNIQLITRAIRILMQGLPERARPLLLKASATRAHRNMLRRWTLLSSLPAPLVRLVLGMRGFTVSVRSMQVKGIPRRD